MGLGAALLLSRLVKDLLFNVTPTDPTTFWIAVSVLWIVALGACFIPARRAARVNPVVALRGE